MKSWIAILLAGLWVPSAFAQSGQVVQSGLIGDYRFTEGIGKTLRDSSGNGNDGSFCSSAPTWAAEGPGVLFDSSGTQCIELPIALNGAKTIQVLIHFQGTANNSVPNRTIVGSNGPGSAGHAVEIVAVESDYNRWTGAFHLAELGGASGQQLNNYFGYLNGTVLMTLVLTGVSGDAMYLNDTRLGLVSSGFSGLGATTTGKYFLGAMGDTPTRLPAKGAQMTMYRALFYGTQLSEEQIKANVRSAEDFLSKRPNFPSKECCNPWSGEKDEEAFAGLIGDSISTGAEPTFWKDMVLDGPENWTKSDMGINGSTSAECLASGKWCAGPMYRPNASKNLVVFFAGGNDISNGASALEAFQTTVGTIREAKASGFTVFVTTLLPRNKIGFDAKRDEFNDYARGQWKNFADGLVDLAADPETGADGKAEVKDFFPDGVHPSAATNYNHMSTYFQRRINRFYGSRDWSGAAEYKKAASAAMNVSACSASGNTVTVRSKLNPAVGSTVFWSGAKPTEYNSRSGGWWVLTTGSEQFTFYHPKAGLAACSQPGEVSVALQKDGDAFQVLNFGRGNYTLESCLGLTDAPIHIRNINAMASTIVPWGQETIDGKASQTIPGQTSVTLLPVFLGPASGGCRWKSVP
jgi:lysophospholipase L1-like esterase